MASQLQHMDPCTAAAAEALQKRCRSYASGPLWAVMACRRCSTRCFPVLRGAAANAAAAATMLVLAILMLLPNL
eukprot:366205-Chlamydomonas_euryale.AAC.8